MTDIWLGDSESAEYFGGDESAEWYDDEDIDFGDSDLYDEASRPTVRREDPRRAAARRRGALEMRRKASRRRSRPAGPVTTASAIRNTREAVREVALADRVRGDAVAGAVRSLGKRNTGLERSVSAGSVVDTLKRELEALKDDNRLDPEVTGVLQTLAEYAPLLFLNSPGPGFRKPEYMAGIAGIVLAGGGFLLRRALSDDDSEGVVDRSELAAPRQPK